MRSLSSNILRILASKKFFYFVVFLLVLQAVWLALSFNYPMLWDEYYHFGLTQFYAHHINPIISNQPQSLDVYGNVARSPKYLFHYLMSFPLRGISLFTANEVVHIVFLRFLNIAMFAGGLFAFRAVLLRMVRARALVNFVLLIFVLLPMSPLLAATINYDNLQFLLTGLVLYWVFRFIQAKKFEVSWLLAIVGTSALASIVKQTFLPIFVAILGYLLIYSWRRWGLGKTFRLLWKDYKKLGRWTRIGLTILLLLGAGLFAERFGGNMLAYHHVEPKCHEVLSVDRCMNFSPYKQEVDLAGRKAVDPNFILFGPVEFTKTHWFHQLYVQLFSTGTQVSYEDFEVPTPLHIPLTTMLLVSTVAVVCFVLSAKNLLKKHEVQVVLLATIALAAALWLVDYEKYRRTGWPLAIQGRYLVPVMLPVMGIGAMAIKQVVVWPKIRAVLATFALVGMIWGGGLLTHITLSSPYWYWQNQIVISVNDGLRKVLSPITF